MRRIDGFHRTKSSRIRTYWRRTGYSQLETPCISEATEVINEIPVKLPSQLLITKITTYFDNNFDPLGLNNSSEA